MRNFVVGAITIVLLGILAVFIYTAFTLVSTVQRTTEPIAELSGQVGTQVAQFLEPTPTILPDPVTIVREVRSLARLETIQYSLEKVITAERGQGRLDFLFGDRLLLVAHGTVIAGVDLSEIGPEDVWFDNDGRVYVRLPEPQIFVATLDNDKSYVYDRDTGLFTRGDVNLEAAARQAAEDEIELAALEDGILDQAQLNAENFIFSFLRSLGFPDVIFADPDESP